MPPILLSDGDVRCPLISSKRERLSSVVAFFDAVASSSHSRWRLVAVLGGRSSRSRAWLSAAGWLDDDAEGCRWCSYGERGGYLLLGDGPELTVALLLFKGRMSGWLSGGGRG